MVRSSAKKKNNKKGTAAPVEPVEEEEQPEIWDIKHVYTEKERASVKCDGEGCSKNAISKWASNLEPDKPWNCCEGCQDAEFGGWPIGFGPNGQISDDVMKNANGMMDNETREEGGGKEGAISKEDVDEVKEEKKVEIEKSYMLSSEEIACDNSSEKESKATDQEVRKKNDMNDVVDKNVEEMTSQKENENNNEGSDAIVSDEDPSPEKKDPQAMENNAEELWALSDIIPMSKLKSPDAIICSQENCILVACCVWKSNLDPENPWNYCIDCQEMDFEGWPPKKEMPKTILTRDHISVMSELCSRQSNPKMPPPTKGAGSVVTPQPSQSSDQEDQSGPNRTTTLTPPPPSSKTSTKGKKASTITPSPHLEKKAEKKPSAAALAMHRKWQEAAEALGGKDARIVVSKPAAKKLIYDMLYESFRPMNITDIYKTLKAVVPSPVLKSCLDDMTDDDSLGGNPFADDSDDDDDDGNNKRPKKKAKLSKASDDPYASLLSIKMGRNSNNILYYVNHTKSHPDGKVTGDGLPPHERNDLAADVQTAHMELEILQKQLQFIDKETSQLLSEPTNEEAVLTLAKEEATMERLDTELERARELVVSEAAVNKVRKKLEVMVKYWRKRRRLCHDFLIMMEDSTEGSISMKKCLKGDGPIELDSDESVLKFQVEHAKKKRAMRGSGAAGGGGMRFRSPMRNSGSIGMGSKKGKASSLKGESNNGVQSNPSFVGVKLDPRGNVVRVHIDDDMD